MPKKIIVGRSYSRKNHLTVSCGDCLRFLRSLPSGVAQLVITSPPYNVGKEYEHFQPLDEFLSFQKKVISECVRITRTGGSICWQVGSHFDRRGDLIPLDAALYPLFSEHEQLRLRNRIVWHFEHGLHSKLKFSGRYETILWYAKGDKNIFNLDSVRVPQKYPGKRSYRGANKGKLSCNRKGKNPGDVWQIPNVKANHVEKTEHPCQFPIALAENLVLALSNRRQLVVDPFLGAGTTALAALRNGRRAAGAEVNKAYIRIIEERLSMLMNDSLPYRPRTKPVHIPKPGTRLTTPYWLNGHSNGVASNGKEIQIPKDH